MIDYLNNWTFFVFALILYLVIILLTAKRFKVYEFIASYKVTKDIKSKITGNKIYTQLNNFVNNKLKPIYIFASGIILLPVINTTGNILQLSSQKISFAGESSEKYLSEIISEGFEIICVLTRKLINSETRSIWTAFLVIVVLFYFILTNL